MPTTEQLNTALAGRYAIDRLVGEGGMATVYLARDLKHNRKVALKVLKPDLGAVVGVERFLSEIEVTANLQHPNLLPLFDSGAADGLLFYVMPYVEGESLRARLDREKQLPVDDAIHIATAVAGALDYAHRHGVIHRDLKPENILMHEGEPLVADFGIALALSNAGGNRITQTGLSLGTPQYMSPEQATGDRAIDARTDIYSLGALTYEMLTGDPPHTGSTSQAIIARVLTERPRGIRISRPSVPVHVEAAVEHALEKLPADRWATAKEFSEALTGARPAITRVASGAPAAGTTAAAQGSRRARALSLVAWVMALAGISGTAYFATRPAAPAQMLGKFRIELPESVTVSGTSANSVALSSDGTLLAIVGEKAGRRGIYVRRLDDPNGDPVARFVRGTEDGLYPSFSTDGNWLVFSAVPFLMRVAITGGTPQKLADSVDLYLSHSGDDGTVLYSVRGVLWRVASDGRHPVVVARPDTTRGVASLSQPYLLPGSRYALITQVPRAGGVDAARLGVVSLADGAVTDLATPGVEAKYSPPGRIVFAQADGRMMTAPFSLRSRTLTGPPTMLFEGVRQSANNTGFAVSNSGTMVYDAGTAAGTQAMYIVDRSGKERQLPGPERMFREPRISPDGRRIAMRIGTGELDGGLWIYDIASGTTTRLTGDSGSVRGEWTHDGLRIVYIDHAGFNNQLVASRPWDGSGEPTVLARGGQYGFQELAIGPANGLSAVRRGSAAVADILLAPTESLSAVRPFVSTAAVEMSPRVSPHGRLLAYSSDASGQNEIYVQQIPGPGPVVPVSVRGGTEPMWGADESTLYFRGPTHMMAATIIERPLAVSRRDSLFNDKDYTRYRQHAAYDVLPNGGGFLMTRGSTSDSRIYVIVNWMQMVAK